jgi:hypothetical protein
MSDGNNWTRGAQGLGGLAGLHETLARVHRIEILAKLVRAKRQIETAKLIEKGASRDVAENKP